MHFQDFKDILRFQNDVVAFPLKFQGFFFRNSGSVLLFYQYFNEFPEEFFTDIADSVELANAAPFDRSTQVFVVSSTKYDFYSVFVH